MRGGSLRPGGREGQKKFGRGWFSRETPITLSLNIMQCACTIMSLTIICVHE